MLRLVRYSTWSSPGIGRMRGRVPVLMKILSLVERLAVDLDLMRAGEAGLPAIEREVGVVVDLVLDARPEQIDDLVLARDDFGHVHP